ncbi:Immune-associated nucleotide-binding protein 12 [Bulinus truncatus]|nr:Immune-associated nucleotide-binding protein 12 [Bulinus truncatus]
MENISAKLYTSPSILNEKIVKKKEIMSRGRLKPEDEECIRVNYLYLQKQLEAKDIVNFLYQHKVISLNDKERICEGKSQLERNEELLNRLLRCGPGEAFNWFLKSLEHRYSYILKEIQRKAEEGSVLEKQQKHIDRLQDDYDNQTRENQSLRNKLAELQEKNTAQADEINALKQTQDAYQEQCKSLEDKIDSLTIIQDEHQEQRKSLENIINSLTIIQAELQEKNTALAEEINGLKNTQADVTEFQEERLSCSESDINLLLIGKTGVGKSALGNSILNRRAFRSSSGRDVTQDAMQEASLINGRVVNVVDTPGFLDTELDTKHIVHAITKVIAIDPREFHAILYVVKYGDRFTRTDCDTLHFLKVIFGANFVKDFCILVVTHGECFMNEAKESIMKLNSSGN